MVNLDIMKSIKDIKLSGEISNEPESQEYELLNAVLMRGMRDVAEYLLDENYKVNRPSEHKSSACTPLHNAVKLNDVQLVKKILNRGASVEVVDPGKNTSLHLAFILGHIEVTDIILNHLRDTSNYINLKNKYGLTHLHIASAIGNTFVTQKLIENEADVKEIVNEESPLYGGYSALRFACTYKKVETIVVLAAAMSLHGNVTDEDADNATYDNLELFKNVSQFLINLQQNKKSKGIPNFLLACFRDNVTIIQALLEKNVDVNAAIDRDSRACPLFTPLHMAIEGESEWKDDKVKLLLSKGASVDFRNGFCMTALHLAMYNHVYKDKILRDETKEDQTLELIYSRVMNKQANPMDCHGLTYLHIAVAMNDFHLVNELLDSGENVNQSVLRNLRQFSTYAPLHFAVKFGHDDMAKLLIKRGADVNLNGDDPKFDSPLQLAIKLGHHRLIDLLLKNKANAKIIQTDGNKTTLHLLAERFAQTSISTSAGLEEKAELQDFAYKLVRLGVDVDAKDSEGCTALHIACLSMYDSIHLVNWLLMVGADVDVVNEDGETAFALACTSGFRGNYKDFLMLYLHVHKLKDLGLKVDPKNEQFCQLVMKRKGQWLNNEDWSTVEKLFSKKELGKKRQWRLCEIQKLKSDMIDERVSLYDYLRMDAEEATVYIENKKLKQIVDEDDWDEYEVYGYLIPAVYRRSLKWLAGQKL